MATILIVEDNDDIRELIEKQLQRRGFTVATASNGVEAVGVCAQSAPALILMDINMPELDGIEATIQIRSASPEKRIPVIALTAYALRGEEGRVKAAGRDAFHTKPIEFPRLFEQIDQLLQQAVVA